MTTGATGQLGLALPVQGELSGTWGDTVNNGITQYTNIAIAATLTLTNDGAVTLANTTGDASASNIVSSLTGAGTVTAQFAIVRVTGTLTTTKVVTFGSAGSAPYSKTYVVVNAATGGSVSFTAYGGSGVTVAVGESAYVYYNGTNIVKVSSTVATGVTSFQTSLSGLTPSTATTGAVTLAGTLGTANGGTNLTSFTSGGVVYASSSSALATGSALTFDGTNLSNTRSVATAFSGTNSATWANGIALTNSATPATGVASLINFGGANNVNSVFGVAQSSSGFGDFVWAGYSGSFSEQMRLTSTGLGIGTSSPVGKLSLLGAFGTTQTAGLTIASTGSTTGLLAPIAFYLQSSSWGTVHQATIAAQQVSGTDSGANLIFSTSATGASAPSERARIDSSGNLGLGVTPSAWYTGYVASQVGVNGSVWANRTTADTNIVGIGSNQFLNSGATNRLYISNGFATRYEQSSGVHSWFTAASGTAGNAISFTQAMTLDASGNLGVGTTSPSSYGKFAVVGSTSQGSSFVSTGTNAFSLISAVSTGATMYLGVAGTAAGTLIDIGGISDNAAYFGSRTNTVTQLIANNTVRATISAAGGFSVGTTADPGAGAIYATGNITAFFSDKRLKTVSGKIENALDKVGKLSGVYYTFNDTAKSFGYDSDEEQVGVIAQEVEAVLPQIVKAAPFDLDENNNSKSGENYKTVQYDKLVPLLIEAINELRAEVKALKGE
jgi:hypothetical protein